MLELQDAIAICLFFLLITIGACIREAKARKKNEQETKELVEKLHEKKNQ